MFFFFNDTATTEIYTLSLHDALPISARVLAAGGVRDAPGRAALEAFDAGLREDGNALNPGTTADLVTAVDRKSTRLNSSHANISYAVFCLKKKLHYTLSIRPTQQNKL